MRHLLLSIVLLGCASTAIACGGANDDTTATPGDEEDIKKGTCVDILTLTCKSGFMSTEDGCAQSHVAGAHPLGRCIAIAPSSSTDLGELGAPGSVLDGSVRSIKPGDTLSFSAGGNQITAIVGFDIDDKTLVAESDVVVKAMTPGQLGDATIRKYTFTVSKDAPANASIKITSRSTYQARNDKNWAFSFTIKVD